MDIVTLTLGADQARFLARAITAFAGLLSGDDDVVDGLGCTVEDWRELVAKVSAFEAEVETR